MRRTITTVAATTATVIAAIKVTKEAKLFLFDAGGNYRLYRLTQEADAQSRYLRQKGWRPGCGVDAITLLSATNAGVQHPRFVSEDEATLIGSVLTRR